MEREAEEDHERATRERQFQLAHQQNRAALQEIKDQLVRDHEEGNQIKKEEARLLAVRKRAKLTSEELCQCDIGLRALMEQKSALLTRLQERVVVSAEQVQQVQEEQASLVEIEMETEDVEDTEMDETVVEQGELPRANTAPEQRS